ncbi:MAG: hypothetical protein HOI70_08460 [Opitutae bacterium]|jgi:hypothetical protein|nr:hypothetical protein [Opitutae bacterium]
MNNIVPFQLPEASSTVLGWNLALGMLLATITAWHYTGRATKKMLKRDLFQKL